MYMIYQNTEALVIGWLLIIVRNGDLSRFIIIKWKSDTNFNGLKTHNKNDELQLFYYLGFIEYWQYLSTTADEDCPAQMNADLQDW